MCSSFVNWTWRWLALTSNVEGSSVSVSVRGLPSVRSSTPALADALGSGTMEMGRKRRHPTSGPRCTLNAIYQFWPRVRESTSQIKSWVRAAGCISACLIAWLVTWQQCGPRWNESTAMGIAATHQFRWYVGECEINLDSRGYHS